MDDLPGEPPSTVATILQLARRPGVHGVMVTGSVARGEATRWSDLDVHAYVRAPAQRWDTEAVMVGDRLVMLASDTLDGSRAELQQPERAIWAVPAFAAMRILRDEGGALAELRGAARAFDLATLRPAAAAKARAMLRETVEIVHKVRAASESRSESAVLHAAGVLIGRCTRAVAVGRALPIPSENEYYARVWAAGGPRWTERHRARFGLGPEGPVAIDAHQQARAACALYAATTWALDDLLDGDDRSFIGRGLALVELELGP